MDRPGGDERALLYCCLGCRLAAQITGQSGMPGAVHWTLVRLGLAIFLSLNVMMFTMALWSQDADDAWGASSAPLAASLADLFRYLCLVLSLPVLFLLGGPMLESAWSDLRRGAAAADVLVVLGVGAAYVYSAISVLRGTGHVYFEVGCAVLVMVTLGRWLEASGKLKASEALDALEKLLPDEVRVHTVDGRDAMLPIAEVRVGMTLRVLSGERLATDGQIEHGQAAVDEQMLTGESLPVAKQPGDRVLGGSLNLDGDLLVRATARPEQSSLARIAEMVREARLQRGRYERLADRVARWFLFGVILVALGALAFHAARGGIDRGLMAALAVLLIACPCALGLATPMAVWSALGVASRGGVLLRNGEALERLATVRAVRFDKTGTLTTGAPQIHRFVARDAWARAEVLRRVTILAHASTHAYATAIARFADEFVAEGVPPGPDEPDRARRPVVCTSPGQGVLAQFDADQTPTYLGNLRWLEAAGLALDEKLARAVTEASLAGRPFSAIGWKGRVEGLFVFAETLRPGARQALERCTALGCDVAVLTGDNAARGRALARELGVPVRAELLPADKIEALARAHRVHGSVAMVGDGINDAPALAACDVGIAMGTGVDVSRATAGVCLLANDLACVPWVIELARRTRRKVLQNLFWAFSYNTIGIALAAAGWLNPAFAAVAMVGSSSMVIANSLRVARAMPAAPAKDVKHVPAAPATPGEPQQHPTLAAARVT
jgi:heavy metal translocating P-type ATPase